MPPATTPYDPLSSLTVTSQDLADTGLDTILYLGLDLQHKTYALL
jgi:hypothetical protein